MKKILISLLMTTLLVSCAQFKKNDERSVASLKGNETGNRDSIDVDQKNFLAAILGRKPYRTLTDLINDGLTPEQLGQYNFYAVHPMASARYFPVNIVSEQGDGYFVVESKTDVKVRTDGLKTSTGEELGPGHVVFEKRFSDHSNNIIFEMPDGSFNNSNFVVGNNICTKKGKTLFNFCGTILKIFSSGELLLDVKGKAALSPVSFF